MKKKFYTFAELNNYLSKLENNKKQRPDSKFWNNVWNGFGAWMADNIDVDITLKFWKYHKHNEGEGTEKIYPKKMWDIEPYLSTEEKEN